MNIERIRRDFAPLITMPKAEVLPGFIVLEGLDGSGTSTQLARLQNYLSEQELAAWTTCEPTDGPIGKQIRRILRGEDSMQTKDQLAVLFSQDRAQHLEEIKRRVADKELVISDRYLFSSLAYQSTEVGPERAFELNKDFLLPQHCFFLDIDAQLSEERRAARAQRERYENLEEQQELRIRYYASLEAFAHSGMLVHILDGSQSIESITEQICEILGL